MSSSRPTQSSNSSNRTGQSSTERILKQTNLDTNFEGHGDSFEYSMFFESQRIASNQQQVHSEKFIAYLEQIKRGNLIQPFGCLLALDAKSLKVIAFSENAPKMLTAVDHAVSDVDDSPNLCIGTNIVTLFADPGATTLNKVLGFSGVSSLNPIIVQCKTSGEPFYAIVHQASSCVVVDFEPVNPSEFPTAAAWASQSYKLAATAISNIQSLPGGSMEVLCNTLVQEVFELTGYDRVMAYKFHEDLHGEVIAEITKPGLEPYLGLHYPATDIPQAARFLFMKNKVRMICDCCMRPVKIIEDNDLPFHVSLCGSTLRAPYICHLQYMKNMKSVASLVIAVVVNEDGENFEIATEEQTQKNQMKKLWGLIICHHGSPRYVPFPLRHACEFIGQVFAVHISKEIELEKNMQEKSILRMQSMLSRMLFSEACPLNLLSGRPNIMDLVKCDGAALLHGDKVWQQDTTPTVTQIRDIATWLTDVHRDSTCLSFDSLRDAAYPGLASLGDMICGMAMAKVTSSITIFWFRSHTTAEIKWGGAKHNPSDKDDCRRMHPRLSFKTFLEVVRMNSLPWNDYEMDAINSLQFVVRGSLKDANKLARVPHFNNPIDHLKPNAFSEVQAETSEAVLLMETAIVPSHELQHALQVQQAYEKTTLQRSRCLDLRMDEFVLQDMVVAAISKVQTACQAKGIVVSCDLAGKFLRQKLQGDCIRLQKILSDFLLASVKYCPVGGSVAISTNRTKNSIGENIDLTDLELRIKQQVIVGPEELLAHMFQEGDNEYQPEEGLTLVVFRNLLSLMN